MHSKNRISCHSILAPKRSTNIAQSQHHNKFIFYKHRGGVIFGFGVCLFVFETSSHYTALVSLELVIYTWLDSQRPACLYVPLAGIKGVCHTKENSAFKMQILKKDLNTLTLKIPPRKCQTIIY